jgi:hypothetical protein
MVRSLARLPDWRALFSSFIAERAASSFEWGENDCAMFAAGGVEAATGVDLAAAFRGRYKTPNGSARAVRRIGEGDLPSTLASLLPQIDPEEATAGDVVIISHQNQDVCGLRLRSNIVCLAQEGLVHFGPDAATHAYRVGR